MPKPVLSDSLFNANDVAEAILNEANLQIANENLGVVDRSSLFNSGPGFSCNITAYSFNGFMFVSAFCAHSGTPAHLATVFSVTDSNYYPIGDFYFPTVSYQLDHGSFILASNTGLFQVHDPDNQGGATYHSSINGFYRYS